MDYVRQERAKKIMAKRQESSTACYFAVEVCPPIIISFRFGVSSVQSDAVNGRRHMYGGEDRDPTWHGASGEFARR
ncbi:hypothetical protein EVAR_54110_1 [Eumeta japonica]|uniref:Uncharacterized protein n=1 Tax=Eumeta variegata TaxID=151549 RepID=A0A4C1Z0C4_EUMVA|nr:hypothetical protein EVAR_54110_1 [Eumeta japonica]